MLSCEDVLTATKKGRRCKPISFGKFQQSLTACEQQQGAADFMEYLEQENGPFSKQLLNLN